MNAFVATLRREARLASARKADFLLPPLFYSIVVTLFGLGAEPNDPALARFAPSVLWVGALLASMLTLDRLFRDDYEDGTLEQVFLAREPALLVVAAKLCAHWLSTGLPMTLLALPLALQLGVPGPTLLALWLGLLLGTPMLSLIGGFAAALTVGLTRAGLLLPVLVLPLIVPVVIFGAGAARSASEGLDPEGPLYFLGALLVLGLSFLPWLACAALRNTFD